MTETKYVDGEYQGEFVTCPACKGRLAKKYRYSYYEACKRCGAKGVLRYDYEEECYKKIEY